MESPGLSPQRRRSPLGTVLFVGVVIIVGALFWYWRGVYVPVSNTEEALVVTVPDGTGVEGIIDEFDRVGLVRSRFLFKVHARVSGSASQLQAGSYTVAGNASTADIVEQLSSGQITDQEVTIRLQEGWTSQEIEEYLLGLGFNADLFVETVQEASLSSYTGSFIAEGWQTDRGVEGYLFPDTYSVFQDATVEQLITLFVDTFVTKVGTAELESLNASADLSFYQVLTLASIVEKEMQTPEDRRIGAGIFLSRLGDSYPLESDATVNYVTGKSALQPTFRDVDTESPYNTYRNAGLPPTPISNPGADAIRAVLEPTNTNYYFFLHAPGGQTIYSVTFDEHLENKAIYLD